MARAFNASARHNGKTVSAPAISTVATALVGLGEALVGQREFARALAIYERALAIDAAALGTEHPDLAEPLSGIGQACLGLHQNQRTREKIGRRGERGLKNAVDSLMSMR